MDMGLAYFVGDTLCISNLLLCLILLLWIMGAGLCLPGQGILLEDICCIACPVRKPEGVECKEYEVRQAFSPECMGRND